MAVKSVQRNLIETVVFDGVMILLSLVGIIWDISTRLLVSGLDGIFLLLICLSMGGVFTLELFVTLRKLGVLKPVRLFARKPADAAASQSAAPAANPPANPAAKTEGK